MAQIEMIEKKSRTVPRRVIQIRLREEQADAIQAMARSRDVPTSVLFREAVELLLARETK